MQRRKLEIQPQVVRTGIILLVVVCVVDINDVCRLPGRILIHSMPCHECKENPIFNFNIKPPINDCGHTPKRRTIYSQSLLVFGPGINHAWQHRGA